MINRRLFAITAGLAAASIPALGASEKEAVESAYKSWNDAFNRGDPKALAALYAEEALLLPPTHSVVKGREAIERFWDGRFKPAMGVTGHSFELIQAEGDPRGVVAAARWSARKKEGNAEQPLGGFATHVFEKRQGGLALWLHTWN